jgi:diguanylate cyclase (GGDEF)-like protein/PAS domain S-box-containing protein
MLLDIRTLVFILGFTQVIQIIVFFHQYLINKDYRGVRYWLMWSAAEVVGFGFMLLRENPSLRVTAIIFQNSMIILGVIFLYIGILHFFERKENRALVVSIFALSFLALSYFIFVENDIQIRSIILAATIVALSFLSAHALLFYRSRSIAKSAIFAAAVFLGHGCFFALRGLILLTGTPEDMMVPTLLNVATYVDALACSVLLAFAFIVMINQRLNAQMQEAKEEIELVFNTSPDAAVISRMSDGLIISTNEGFTVLSGYTRDEVVGESTLTLNFWKNPDDRQSLVHQLREKGFIENFETRFQTKDGSRRSGLVSAKTITLREVPHIISITRDITDRKLAEQALRESELKFHDLFEYSGDAIYITTREGRFTDVNRAYLDLFGSTREEMVQLRARDTYVNPTDRDLFKKMVAERGFVRDHEIELRKKNGQKMDCLVTATAKYAHDGSIAGYQGIIRNITEKKKMEEKLRALSNNDDLTGLYNRRGFLVLSRQQMRIAERTKRSMLFFFADLDGMKWINDTLGHHAGDKALVEIATVLKRTFRKSDIIGRMGGDEFAVLAVDHTDETREVLIERLYNFLDRYNNLGGRGYTLSLSVGATYYNPDEPCSVDEMIRRADEAMYEEKRSKKQTRAVAGG